MPVTIRRTDSTAVRGFHIEFSIPGLLLPGGAGSIAEGTFPPTRCRSSRTPTRWVRIYLTNYSSSSYNALQVEVRHRTKSGLFFEANYTWSKVLSDADGDVQNRLQHFLDIANPKIERSRANFDLTHMIKMDGYYELPFGKGHKLSYRPLDRVIGGWIFGSTLTWQSGAPFSILSGRGTLNRESRSTYNTADTSLTKGQLDSVVKFQMTGNGPMMITQSAINRRMARA